jgi:OmcA/MtrC family decaheme c-type cytochrome
LVALIAISLTSAPRKPYSIHEKAFYADDATVQFVRPGLTITINSAAIAKDGTITVTYTVADPSGLPLDTTGVTTPGTISLSFIAAVIPNNQEQYTSYTTSVVTGTKIASTQQAGADSGGSATNVGPGQYQYTFHTKAPTGFDVTATHTIGIYGSRNLTVYSLGTNYASATYNFVPNGSKVTHVRDLIETKTCDTCHDQLSAHGGSRRGLNLCILCHQPQTVDPNTGDTLDAKVFFHKLHLGARLPSVVAGTPYIPAINSHGIFNYSAVVFPASSSLSDSGAATGFRCTKCHDQKSGATQAMNYATMPGAVVCGSCHDDVNFATGVNHPGGPQPDDSMCANCHIPQGELPFDASIIGAHTVPEDSTLLGGVQIALKSVTNGVAGKTPTINFTLLDGKGNPLPYSQMSSLTFIMAGPTTQYGYTSFGSTVTTPGYVTESGSATTVTCSAAGACSYTFTHAIPANATGSYAISFYGSRAAETLLTGTTAQVSVTESPFNNVIYFSVDGSPVVSRRQVVAASTCNGNCHYQLELHGGSRRNPELCIMCHNPQLTDSSTRPSATVPALASAPPQGVNFNLLIHRLHYGVNQPSNRPYIVVGFNGTTDDFSTTLYPALSPTGSATDLENCSMCHVNGSEQNLPELLGPVLDPQGPVNPNQPVSSACTGCHMDIPSASHMLSNTTTLGEACTVCHGSAGAYAVDQVHAQY